MQDIAKWLRHEATSKEPGFMDQGSVPSERYQKLMEAAGEIVRLRAEEASTARALHGAQLQLSIALQGVPPQLETLEIGFRRAYDMICAALRDEQNERANDEPLAPR